MKAQNWPSLGPQIELAAKLFGARGLQMVEDWFQLHIDRITDPGFARLFSDHIDLPGVATADYNQRHVVTNLGQLIGGIRFFAQNLDHPFVEVIAHDFDDLGALRKCVAREWAVFKPRDLRVISEPDVPLPVNARVDMTIHAARYSNMTEADGRVTLFPFSAPEEACAIVEQKFSDLRQTAPDLARVLSAATPENLSDWHDAGHLCAIGADVNGARETVGLFAAAPGVVEWLEGDIVEEEIVLTGFNGHGFAASAQCAWAIQAGRDRDRLLIGTINGLNPASRVSATRAGRPAVLQYVFLELDP